MSTVDKKKISNMLNEIFDTKIDWTKLTVKELQDLMDVFSTPTKLVQAFSRATKSKINYKIKDMKLSELFEGEGLLGFGIIPSIVSGLKENIAKKEEDKQ